MATVQEILPAANALAKAERLNQVQLFPKPRLGKLIPHPSRASFAQPQTAAIAISQGSSLSPTSGTAQP